MGPRAGLDTKKRNISSPCRESNPDRSVPNLVVISTELSRLSVRLLYVRGPFAKFVDWRQCAAVTQREAATVIPSCSGGINVVVV
jgi:hypothetical protein